MTLLLACLGSSQCRADESSLSMVQYAPNEGTFVDVGRALTHSVTVHGLTSHASSTVVARMSLYHVARGDTVQSETVSFSIDAGGNSNPISLSKLTPKDAGVYELRCAIEPEPGYLWSAFRRRETPIVDSSRTIVAIRAGEPTKTEPSKPWETVDVIRPSESGWAVDQWLPKQATRLLPDSIGMSGELKSSQVAGETVSWIDPQNIYQAALPVLRHHIPHKITLRYPAAMAGDLRVEVAAGDNRSGNAIAFELTRDTRATIDSSPWTTRSFVYFPSGNDQIWLTNLSDARPVAVESIRIEAGPDRLSDAIVHSPRNRDAALVFPGMEWHQRMSSDLDRRDVMAKCSPRTSQMYRTWMATDRLMDDAIFRGMNGICIRVRDGDGNLFAAPNDSETLDVDRLRMVMRLAAKRDLNVYLLDEAIAGAATSLEINVNDETNFAGTIAAPQPVATTNQSSTAAPLALVSPTSDRVTPIERFVHGPAERLSIESALQHQLMSLPRAAGADEPRGVLIGQSDQLGTPPTSGAREALRWHRDLDVEACRLIDQLDPHLLLVQLPSDASMLTPKLANVLAAFTAMPTKDSHLHDVTEGSASTVRVHISRNADEAFVSMFNLAPWDNTVQFDCDASCRWTVVSGDTVVEPVDASVSMTWTGERAGNSMLETPSQTAPATATASITKPSGPTGLPPLAPGTRRYQVVVPTGGVVVIKSVADADPINDWIATPAGSDDAVAAIKQQITSIVQSIGTLGTPASCDGLVNGGFEQSGGMGLIGWLHAQHPPECVRIDTDEKFQGAQSVVLTTDSAVSTRTWLVSETITPPASGRLAVSMACRGELNENAPPHKIRVSIEATQGGVPIRHSAEIDIARSGQWEPKGIVVEADGITPEQTESMRLTIDSLSGGRVWIDDIQLHDHFPTAKEQAELQSQAFLAVQGLHRNNLTPSARLLHNQWARHLLTESPPTNKAESDETLTAPSVTGTSETATDKPTSTPAKTTEEAPPGMAERVRSWLPRPLRF